MAQTQSKSDYARTKFVELIPKFQTDQRYRENSGKLFRRTVMGALMARGCTQNSAATLYNNVLQSFRREHPELVEGLGRPGLDEPVLTPAQQQEQIRQALEAKLVIAENALAQAGEELKKLRQALSL